MPSPASSISRSTSVAAPAGRVWGLVSDLPRMAEFSPENEGGRWLRGASGPAVGATFRGRNRNGRRRWSTRCTVTRCEPGRGFAFAVTSVGLPVAEWAYEIEPEPDGCRLTETWTDRRGRLIRTVGRLATGVADREAFTATSLEQTLERVKSVAERQD